MMIGEVHLADAETVHIAPGAAIFGPAFIGRQVFIGTHSVVGVAADFARPRDKNLAGALGSNVRDGEPIGDGHIVVGDSVVIREHCVIHNSKDSSRPTLLENDVFMHSRCGISHGCQLRTGVVLAPGVTLCGDVTIGQYAQIGAQTVINQGIQVGACAMVGSGAVVTRDLPPLTVAYGVPARVRGVNRVFLQRRQVKDSIIVNMDLAMADGQIESALGLMPPDLLRSFNLLQ